jgi:glutathione S-transferase
MTMRPILYSFRRCPYAMRARMALLASGQTVQIREILLRAKPQAMRDASPKATVPVLVLPDGTVIDESLDIMRWALERGDPAHWLDGADHALIATNDGAFKHHLDRYKYPERYKPDGIDHRSEALALLRGLETRLSAHDYLCGDCLTMTDVAIFPFVRQFAATDQAWFNAQEISRVQHWLSRLLSSDLFAAAMVRHAPWQPGDAPIMFGAPD